MSVNYFQTIQILFNLMLLTVTKLRKNKKCFLAMFLLYFYYYYIRWQQPFEGHLIIISTTYYKYSTLYSNNTAVILFNAETTIPTKQEWKCISKDKNDKVVVSKTKTRHAYPYVPNCQWTTYITTCSTIEDPVSIELSVKYSGVELPLRNAVTENLPIVACFSPLFFNERWQLITLSIESYLVSGVSRQAYYLMSAVKDVYDLIKFYENQGIVDINSWNLPKHSKARIELDWRNQGAAHTDCFLKYREAAEFIIISDIDDLLFPRQEYNLFNELKFYLQIYPNSSSFFYPRFNAEISVAKNFAVFNPESSLQNVQISDKIMTGKSVYKTSLTETVWLHWAGITKQSQYHQRLNITGNIFVHLRNWNFDDKYDSHPFSNMTKTPSNMIFPNLTSLISPTFISTIAKNFKKRFQKRRKFQRLVSTEHYYDAIDTCYNSMLNSIGRHIQKHKSPATLCPTPVRCKFQPLQNLLCAVAVSSYKTHNFTKNFSVDILTSLPTISINENGCLIN